MYLLTAVRVLYLVVTVPVLYLVVTVCGLYLVATGVTTLMISKDYIKSINEIKDKFLRCGFNKKVKQTMIQKVGRWTERFRPINQ